MNRLSMSTSFALLALLLLAATAPKVQAAPANDNFANRISLGSGAASVSSNNFDATTEAGETFFGPYGSRTLWYTWTAPSSGVCSLRVSNYFNTPLLAVYTGNAVDSLTSVSSSANGGAATFVSTAGTVYQFAVGCYYYDSSFAFTLSIGLPAPSRANDNFADRASLGSGAASVSSNNLQCTKEAGEPNHAGWEGGRSVWFTWTAPSSGECRLRISDYRNTGMLMAVYTGDAVDALTPVANRPPGSQPVIFAAVAGAVYQIAVDIAGGYEGIFTLSIDDPIPLVPANDNFADAITIPDDAAIFAGANVGASLEPGEPSQYPSGYTASKSVWFRWTAPVTGERILQVGGYPDIEPLYAVYTGSAVASLTRLTAFSYWPVSMRVVAGTTYHIAVDGANGATGRFYLHLSQLFPQPANDNFASRTVLPGTKAVVFGNIMGSTRETSEPGHGANINDGGTYSLWWSWTAPSSGEVSLSIDHVDFFPPQLSVYTGSSVNALTRVVWMGEGYPRHLSFAAVAGTTYQIALESAPNFGVVTNGAFSFHLDAPIAPASNDDFANRIVLPGTASTFVGGSNQGATKEAGEPNHNGNVGGKSVWYSWTAPVTGSYTAYVQGGQYFSLRLLDIYTGAAVGSLTAVPKTYVGSSPTAYAFSATAGTTYHIAVDGSHNGQFAQSGEFLLNISQPPGNETFANATNLGSTAGGTSSSWVDYGSGTESGEPDASPYPWVVGARTIWWQWTAPASGFFNFDTLESSFDTSLQIYTGSSANALTLMGENRDADSLGRSSLALNATAGTTYHIRVRGEIPDDVGLVSLRWAQFGSSVTTADHVAQGRAYLQQQTNAGITNADAAFASALALDANHAEANFLKALTTFALLEQGTAFQNTLTALGIVDSDIYGGGYTLPKDGQGKYTALPGTSTTAVGINYLADTVMPTLTVIRAHLAKASSPAFVTTLSDTETAGRFITMDAGDVSLIQATLHGLEAVTRLLQTYNAGVNVADVFTAANNDQLNVENVAKSFTNLLTFTGNDQRAAFKTALQSANTYYQAGSTFVRTTRANKRDRRHLFYLRASAEMIEEEVRENLQATSNSLNGATNVGGETVNLAQAITSPKSLREQLFGLVGNKGVASTVPDPTFGGVVPNSSQAKVNRFLRRTGFLHEISNFSSWAAAFLSGQTTPNQAKGADPDKDMLSNFAEYAFNLNPGRPSATQEYAVNSLQTNVSDGKKYLTLTFVRRIDRATISYVVAVSDNLTTWDRTGTQLEQVGAAAANSDGLTETVAVRVLADPQVTSRKFVRLEVSELNP